MGYGIDIDMLVDIVQPYHDLCFFGCLFGAFDAYVFDGVVGLSDAGGIDKTEEHAVDYHCLFDGVACGAVDVAYDSSVVGEQCVEQGRLTHVGVSHDGNVDAVFDGIPECKAFG